MSAAGIKVAYHLQGVPDHIEIEEPAGEYDYVPVVCEDIQIDGWCFTVTRREWLVLDNAFIVYAQFD